MLKKILKRTAIVLFILIALAFLAPFIFKKQILQLVKREVNRNINADVDFADVSISFFRSFPKVSVALDHLQVVGRDEFEHDTLLSASRIDATVNFMSLVRGSDYKIYSVEIDQPRIHAIVHKNGRTNWDISLPDSTASADSSSDSDSPFQMQLEKYAIHNGYISYQDEAGNMSSEIVKPYS